MKTRKVGIIGLGHVGAHVMYSLAVQGIADELVLVDHNAAKVESERQDLADSAAYLPHRVHVHVGDFSDLGDCDVIVNSVGKIELLETHDRLTEMDFTIPAVEFTYYDTHANAYKTVKTKELKLHVTPGEGGNSTVADFTEKERRCRKSAC